MSKDFLSIGCINNIDKCNYIKPERLVAFDGINPETNRQFTRTEITNNKNTYKRILTVIAVVLMLIAFKDDRQFESAVKDLVTRYQTKVLKAPVTRRMTCR